MRPLLIISPRSPNRENLAAGVFQFLKLVQFVGEEKTVKIQEWKEDERERKEKGRDAERGEGGREGGKGFEGGEHGEEGRKNQAEARSKAAARGLRERETPAGRGRFHPQEASRSPPRRVQGPLAP